MPIEKFHDVEFSPEVLLMLRRKEILERANCVNAVPLDYGISTRLVEIEDVFQIERRENPLLELTPPEAWIAAVLMDQIRDIRGNVQIRDRVLSDAVQKYLRHHCPRVEAPPDKDEQKLVNTIEPFLPAVRSLFDELFDRRKSIFGILGLRVSSGSIRRIVSAIPKSKREQIAVQAINEGWPPRRLAQAWDAAGLKPRNRLWKSYMELLFQDRDQFYVLKSQIARKYLLKVGKSLT
jgi:hypothetical protein